MRTYLLFAIIPLLIGYYAQYKVHSAYKKNSSIRTQTGVTGYEAARKMLDEQNLTDVRIEKVSGTLTDHYAPQNKVLRLSEGVYSSNSIAAVGVACHEAGHAYQHADNYEPLKLRSLMIPAVNFGSRLGPIIFMIGLLMTGIFHDNYIVAKIGLAIFSITALFSVVTLPVEFNASDRAKTWLSDSGLLYQNEVDGVSEVLNAAALTYVSAAIQAVANILYYLSILNSRSSRDRR